MQLSSMYKWKSSWKCHHHIFDKLLRNCRPLISDWFWNRPDMRSSFNQLLAALASFDLLYLFTMLLEGVSSSFSFLYFERMSKMKKTYSWVLQKKYFECVILHLFLYVTTILPADLEVLFICWSSPVRKMILDIGVSNRRSLGFVQIWQERGEEGKGRATSKAGQGRICRRRTIGQKAISAICYSSTQPEYLNLLVSFLLVTSAG